MQPLNREHFASNVSSTRDQHARRRRRLNRCRSLFQAALLAVSLGGAAPSGRAAAPAPDPIDPELLRRFEARVFPETGPGPLRYRFFRPATNEASTRFPIVLLLHGAVGRGEDNLKQFSGGNKVPPLALSAPAAQAKFPCFIVVPQCPRSDGWQRSDGGVTPTMSRVLELMMALEKQYPVDPKRRYLVGLSIGGSAVWDTLLHHPRHFAAAVPICSAGDPSMAKSLVAVPIWCFHGDADPLVSVEYARAMIAALRQAGGQPKYTEYPGVGHNSYEKAFQEPELLPWLFAQRLPEAR